MSELFVFIVGAFIFAITVPASRPVTQQALQAGGMGKLGSLTEATVGFVELLLQLLAGHVQWHRGQRLLAAALVKMHGRHEIDQRAILFFQIVASITVKVGDLPAQPLQLAGADRRSMLEDIEAVAAPVLRHRIIANFNAEADGVTTDNIVEHLLEQTSPESVSA